MYDEQLLIKNLSDLNLRTLYTIDELAPILRVSRRTLRRYCKEKVFENAVKLGGKRWLIPGGDVLALFPGLVSLPQL